MAQKPKRNGQLYKVSTDRRPHLNFLVIATSPDRAISKLKRLGKHLLDRGETISNVTDAGTIDVF